MKRKTTKFILTLLIVCIVIVLLLGLIAPTNLQVVFGILLIVLLIAWAVIYGFLRCPKCGTWPRSAFDNYCRQCGQELKDKESTDKGR